jgi:hypothetical protein
VGLAGKPPGRFIGTDPLFLQFFEDAAPFLAGLGAGLPGRDARVVLSAGREAHRPQGLIEACADGWVGDAELGFDILDDAAVLDEDLDEGELVAAETLKAPELEASFDLGVAAPTMEPGHRQLVSADGAATDDRMQRHAQGSLMATILRCRSGGR